MGSHEGANMLTTPQMLEQRKQPCAQQLSHNNDKACDHDCPCHVRITANNRNFNRPAVMTTNKTTEQYNGGDDDHDGGEDNTKDNNKDDNNYFYKNGRVCPPNGIVTAQLTVLALKVTNIVCGFVIRS